MPVGRADRRESSPRSLTGGASRTGTARAVVGTLVLTAALVFVAGASAGTPAADCVGAFDTVQCEVVAGRLDDQYAVMLDVRSLLGWLLGLTLVLLVAGVFYRIFGRGG